MTQISLTRLNDSCIRGVCREVSERVTRKLDEVRRLILSIFNNGPSEKLINNFLDSIKEVEVIYKCLGNFEDIDNEELKEACQRDFANINIISRCNLEPSTVIEIRFWLALMGINFENISGLFTNIIEKELSSEFVAVIEEASDIGDIEDKKLDELLDKVSSLLENIKKKRVGRIYCSITTYLFIANPTIFLPHGGYLKQNKKAKALLEKISGVSLDEICDSDNKIFHKDSYKKLLKNLHIFMKKHSISNIAELICLILSEIKPKEKGIHRNEDKTQKVRNTTVTASYVKDMDTDVEDRCGPDYLGVMTQILLNMLRDKGQVIIYGPPGTGKTWFAMRFSECLPGAVHEFVTFHQSYSYEEFIEGIWPEAMESMEGYGGTRFVFMEVTGAPAPQTGNVTHVGRFLWGPGLPYMFLGNLADVRRGDIVLHYISGGHGSRNDYRGAFIGYSVAKGDPIEIRGKDKMREYLEEKGLLADDDYRSYAENWVGENKKYEIFYVVELENFTPFKKPVKISEIKEPKIKHKLGIAGCQYYVRIIPFENLNYISNLAETPITVPVRGGREKRMSERVGESLRYSVRDGIFKRMAILATCDLLRNVDAEVLGKVVRAGRDVGGDYDWCKKLVIEFLRRVRELDWRTRSWLRGELRKASEGSRKYVLIIDEINRGDISRIFGDLISLLEKDKRLGAVNEIIATLPYSREPFAVPPNLYVIGTMNTADRSIALVDIALRRRFGFLEMPPDPTVIEREARNGELAKALATLLRKLNRQIEEALDRDHRIGHSYFLGVESAEDLGRVWVHEVMPLLSEYFYGRWGDLREVLSRVVGNGLADKFFVKIGEDYELRDWREWYEVSGNIEELYRRVGEDIIKNLKVTETAAKEQEVPAP